MSEEIVSEGMPASVMNKREKIVKSMKKNFKDFRKRYGSRAKEVMYATATKMAMKESSHDLQGSSIAKVPYDELDMDNLVQSAISKIGEDDGPHTSKLTDTDTPNFTTVVDPATAVNQPNSLGNVDADMKTASRMTGKPFKTIRKKMGYGIEDLTGAVAGVAIGEETQLDELSKKTLTSYVKKAEADRDASHEKFKAHKAVGDASRKAGDYTTAKHHDSQAIRAMGKTLKRDKGIMRAKFNAIFAEAVKSEADKGEYDYEGDMAKSQLRSIIHNAQKMHDMLEENTNLPEWVQSKITLAEDYISTAANYMQSEMSEEVQLDELSNEKLKSYIDKAGQAKAALDTERMAKYKAGNVPEYNRITAKSNKRQQGINKAKSKIADTEPHEVHVAGKKWKSFKDFKSADSVAKSVHNKTGKHVTLKHEKGGYLRKAYGEHPRADIQSHLMTKGARTTMKKTTPYYEQTEVAQN